MAKATTKTFILHLHHKPGLQVVIEELNLTEEQRVEVLSGYYSTITVNYHIWHLIKTEEIGEYLFLFVAEPKNTNIDLS